MLFTTNTSAYPDTYRTVIVCLDPPNLNTNLTSAVNNFTGLERIQKFKHAMGCNFPNTVYNAIGKVCGAQRTCPAVSQSVTAILLPLTVIEPEAREKKYY
jgi:hypothetical protein